ncbi:MAG TPA: NnrS family protein, partial [Pseudorhizobium sp.]|nr:NnrS family protein [Pseudorhizobium sp.]
MIAKVKTSRTPIPRGLRHTGPVILAYGFRPFFLAAGIWGVLAMALWIIALTIGVPIGGDYGGAAWHAHEMLFGYSSAALAGFLLTAIPNWTGRLPVSGTPLA